MAQPQAVVRRGRCVCIAPGNIHASPLKFEIEPEELRELWTACEEVGELGAIYHSHVRSEPYPSQTDVNFAANWPGVEWIIVGLAGGEEPQVRSYLIDGERHQRGGHRGDGDVSEEPLVCPGCARTYPRRERFCAMRAACRSSTCRDRSARQASASARRARSSPSTPKGSS